MAAGQPLRGLIGQSMSGRKAKRNGYCRVYQPGSYTFVAPSSGRFKFVMWGPGGGWNGATTDGGGSGAYVEKTLVLTRGQSVPLVVGAGASSTSTKLTSPAGAVATAGAAVANVGGTATGGDVMLNGSAGGAAGAAGSDGLGTGGGLGGTGDGTHGGGAGAPGVTEFPGGRGQDANSAQLTGVSPGGGQSFDSPHTGPGGDGRIIVHLAFV